MVEFRPQWGAAVFYDVGTATDNWPDKQIFQGVGVGARWRSPRGIPAARRAASPSPPPPPSFSYLRLVKVAT